MIASDIILQVSKIVNDVSNITYSVSDLIDNINDAQKLITIYKPDALSETITYQITSADSKQKIPSGYRRLLSVIRNTGGQAIRSAVSIDSLTDIDLNWHTKTGANIVNYAYDERTPDEFYIYPVPASLPHSIELSLVKIPAEVVTQSDSITVNEVYSPIIVSWCAYRLLARDNDSQISLAIANEHKNTVFSFLGIKSQSDLYISPNNKG